MVDLWLERQKTKQKTKQIKSSLKLMESIAPSQAEVRAGSLARAEQQFLVINLLHTFTFRKFCHKQMSKRCL